MDTKTLIRSCPIVSMPGVPTDRKEVLQDTRHVWAVNERATSVAGHSRVYSSITANSLN